MRKLRKWLHLLLVICLIAGSILPYLPAMKLTVSAQETDGSGSREGTTTTVNKFYVDGVGSGLMDGTSKDNAFKTLADAYAAIQAKQADGSGATDTYYIVVCGEVTLIKGAEQSGTAKHYALPKHNGKVVITSVYGEENYKTQGAKLNLSDNIYLLGDTVFENIKFSGTATQFNANYFSLHFSEGIETENNASIAKYIRMGTSNKMKTMGSESVDYISNGTITAKDVTLTIDSGIFEKVFGRSYDYQSVNAKENSITVNVNGGTIVDLCGSNVRKDTGKEAASVTVNVAGDAKITNLYGAGVGAIINGDVKVNVKGGTITNLYGVGEFHAKANTEYTTEIRGNVEVWLQGGTVTNVQGIQDDDTVSGNVTVAGDTLIHVGSETMPTVKDFTDIKLLNDVAATADVTIESGATLDLNGNTLNMGDNYLYSLGDVVDNSTNKAGRLKVATYAENEKEGIQAGTPKGKLTATNSQVPIYIADKGYMFATMKGQSSVSKTVSETDASFTVISRPSFGADHAEKLANGADAAKLQFIIRLEWTDNGTSYYQNLKYVDDLVKTVYNEEKAFSATVNGLSAYKDSMKVTVLVKSDLGVEWENNSFYMSTSVE